MLDILTHLPFWIGFASGVVCAVVCAALLVWRVSRCGVILPW